MSRKKQLSNRLISGLCAQLGSIVQSGISISDGLFMLAKDEDNSEYREVLLKLQEDIEGGCTVTEAVEKSGAFPRYFSEMITVGEKTGRLDTVLLSLSDYYNNMDELAAAIKGAVIYPSILLITVFAVIVVLAVYVLPVFQEVFAQLGITLDGGTAFVMSLGNAVSNITIYIIAAFLLLIILGVILYFAVPSFKAMVKKLFSHTKTAKSLYSARFANALSMTLSSGLDVDESMDMCEKLVQNEAMREKISVCKDKMRVGQSFTTALSETGIFSPLQTKMINIGFTTGTLDSVMKEIAEKAESKVNDMINNLVARLEPALIVIMSLAVGFILISVMLPLLGIMTVIG